MDETARPPALRQFVEEVGLMFDLWGLPRMAGRILGELLTCDPPYRTAGELATALNASKGSISTATRLLSQLSLIERIAFPGERRDYYRIAPLAWSRAMNERLSAVTAFRQLAERGLAILPQSDTGRADRLREMRDLYAFMERELPALMARWDQEHTRSERNGMAATPIPARE